MPELPEVEIYRRALERRGVGRRVERAEALPSRLFREEDPAAACAQLMGRTLLQATRKGKYLLLTFDQEVGLLAHLGMSGRFLFTPPEAPAPDDRQLSLHLDDGTTLHYTSVRLLGRLRVGSTAQLEADPGWSKLGPDPLNELVTPRVLREAMASTRGSVKAVLMNQQRLAGLGNIQVTEALWLSQLHPEARAASLDPEALARLWSGIMNALRSTLAELEDAETVAYLSSGEGTNTFAVYGREGAPCPRCGDTIQRAMARGRPSFWCPGCQPLSPEA